MDVRPAVIIGAVVALVAVVALAGDAARPARVPGLVVPTGTSRPTGGPASAASGDTPAPPLVSSSIRPGHDRITGIDFGALVWTDVTTGAAVQLTGGKAVVGEKSYALEPTLTIADADGDGEADALTRLIVTEAGKTTSYAYIWLWSTGVSQPVQVLDIVNIYAECGNQFTSAGADPVQGFRMQEAWHDPNDGGCAAKHAFTRTVTVGDERRLFQTAPYFGYGGYCNPTAFKPEVLPAEVDVRTHPSASAPVAHRDTALYVEMLGKERRTWPDGWRQVAWWSPEQDKKKEFWGTCGFVRLP